MAIYDCFSMQIASQNELKPIYFVPLFLYHSPAENTARMACRETRDRFQNDTLTLDNDTLTLEKRHADSGKRTRRLWKSPKKNTLTLDTAEQEYRRPAFSWTRSRELGAENQHSTGL